MSMPIINTSSATFEDRLLATIEGHKVAMIRVLREGSRLQHGTVMGLKDAKEQVEAILEYLQTSPEVNDFVADFHRLSHRDQSIALKRLGQ